MVIPMVTPKYDNRVVSIGTGLKGIENSAHHCIGVTNARKIAVNRILDRTQSFEFLVDTGPRQLRLFYLWREVFKVIVPIRWKLNLSSVVEVKVSLRTVVGKMRRIDTNSKKEWLVVLFL